MDPPPLEARDSAWLVWSAGVALFVLGLFSVLAVPVAIAPYSFVVLVPAFALGSVLGEPWLFVGAAVGALLAPALFVVLRRQVVSTGRAFPVSSVVIFGVIFTLSILDALVGWHGTVQYTWRSRAIALVAQAVVPPVVILGVALFIRRRATLNQSVVLHWLASAWIAWSAFPWYGELI
jgi:hypothetical protein